VRSLLSLLEDHDPSVRSQAATALGDFAGEAHRVLPALHAALKGAALQDADEAVRTAAVRALLQAGPQPASEVAALVDALHEEIDVVRFHAAIALGNLGREARAAVPALTHAHLWDADPAVRVEAAVALWKIDRKGAVVIPALIKALGDDNEMLCWIAADCLGQMGPEAREAVPALRQALLRPFKISLIRKGVTLALQEIDPRAAAEAGVGGPAEGEAPVHHGLSLPGEAPLPVPPPRPGG
jgi:HEAT repeat protein